VKRSDTDEPVWVVKHIYKETAEEISLYSYPYLKLAKTPSLSYYLLCFFFNECGEQEGRTGSTRRWSGGGERWPK
jgi:hypothetical protein